MRDNDDSQRLEQDCEATPQQACGVSQIHAFQQTQRPHHRYHNAKVRALLALWRAHQAVQSQSLSPVFPRDRGGDWLQEIQLTMSHDVIADALNKIMNAKRSRKSSVSIRAHSKLLLSVLAIAKLRGYIKHYALENRVLTVELDNINGCKAIKPRTVVHARELDVYVRRYLPAKDIGIIIVSTSQGLMTHQTAQEKNLGGSLIAYFY